MSHTNTAAMIRTAPQLMPVEPTRSLSQRPGHEQCDQMRAGDELAFRVEPFVVCQRCSEVHAVHDVEPSDGLVRVAIVLVWREECQRDDGMTGRPHTGECGT